MRATFPAGTLSGAPKIRAMQIISELEQTARGPYGGCVGYFSFNGNLDCCITIRTALLKDGKAYVQAGGGWVNDSTPEGEYQETVNKAKAMLKAVAMAESFGELAGELASAPRPPCPAVAASRSAWSGRCKRPLPRAFRSARSVIVNGAGRASHRKPCTLATGLIEFLLAYPGPPRTSGAACVQGPCCLAASLIEEVSSLRLTCASFALV